METLVSIEHVLIKHVQNQRQDFTGGTYKMEIKIIKSYKNSCVSNSQ